MATLKQKAQVLNLTIETNADWDLSLILKDDEGIVADLTGYTAKMQIRRFNSTQLLIELSTENGRIQITPLEGKIFLSISDIDLATIPVVPAEYDLLITGVNTDRLLEGKVDLIKGVTK
jgi:hypothetical protein